MHTFPDPSDSKKHDFSLAVLTAKPEFYDLINRDVQNAPKDDLVAFTPSPDFFAGYSSNPKYGSYKEFLDNLKPKLLRAELELFGLTATQLGIRESEQTLSEFFELSFRDAATGISENLAGTLEHLDSVDLGRRDFSLALMAPKPPFFEWLDQYSKVAFKGKFKPAQLYPMEYRGAIIIPKKARFTSASFSLFLDRLKPSLISTELAKLGRNSRQEFKYPDTQETFDTFFDLQIRESIAFMSDLMK